MGRPQATFVGGIDGSFEIIRKDTHVLMYNRGTIR